MFFHCQHSLLKEDIEFKTGYTMSLFNNGSISALKNIRKALDILNQSVSCQLEISTRNWVMCWVQAVQVNAQLSNRTCGHAHINFCMALQEQLKLMSARM